MNNKKIFRTTRLSLSEFMPRCDTLSSTLVLLSLLLLIGTATAHAEAQLMVSPTRVVFEGKTRTTEVNIINAGTSAGTFRIAFERKRMTEDGAYEDIGKDEPGMFADPYVRFSPRQVTLAPGQSQIVRLLLRKPSGLDDGEYRSHLLFQSIPDAAATAIDEQVQENSNALNIRLIPILGISIPVIVRQGDLNAHATLSRLSYQPPTEKASPALSVVIERNGSESVYGDLIVKYRPHGEGQEYVVGLVKGIAVYVPNSKRNFTVSLQLPEGIPYLDGVLEATYRQPEEEGGKVLASAQVGLSAPGN